MFNIRKFNKIAQVGLDNFNKDFVATDDCENPDGILVRSAALHDYAINPALKAIARAGAGTNNIPIDACTEKGVVVFNTPGANANGVKELVIAGLMLTSRDIVGGIEWAKTLKGQDGVPALVEKGKSKFAGSEILGKTLGVIGMGMIGILVANAAYALGMKVVGYDPFLSDEKFASMTTDGVKRVSTLDEIYAGSDYITIHVPLNDATKHTVNKETVAKMKDGVKILNFARGELCDDAALSEGLESGKISAYITDFPNASTLEMKNAIAVPHLGASTEEAEDNCAVMAVRQLQDFILSGNIKNSVNFPNISLDKAGAARVCVLYKTNDDILGKLNAVCAKAGIAASTSAVKGANGCAIFDLSSKPDSAVEAELTSIDGVLKVRVIG